MKKDTLVKAAQELNEKLGLDPAIDIKVKGSKLKQLILEAGEMIEKGDAITKTTLKTIESLKEAAAQVILEEETPTEEADEEATEETAETETPEDITTEPKDAPEEGDGEEEMPETPEPKTKAKTKAPKKESGEKKPGIISTIISLIEKAGKKGISKEKIATELEKAFPERDATAMKKTVNVQVPYRISKERFQLAEKDGKYSKVPE